MPLSTRLAIIACCFTFSAHLKAAPSLELVRSGVGIVGLPQQLSGTLDTNGNGRPELLVAAGMHVSVVEEDASPRGYREVARVHSPDNSPFEGAMLVDIPGEPKTLLLRWVRRMELRDVANLSVVKATTPGLFERTAIGDIDGDGSLEIVVGNGYWVKVLDPVDLTLRGTLPISATTVAVANIVGDARAEIISDKGSAYSVTRNGPNLSSIQVWNAGMTGTWHPYPVDVDGRAAIVLHDASGFSAQLATFWPTASVRPLVTVGGASFRPLFADVNGDGCVDMIAATNSEVRALDIASGVTLWETNTIHQLPELGPVHSPITTDLDGDGMVELAWAEQYTTSGIVAVSLPLSATVRWRSDTSQVSINDWTLVRNAQGSTSIAYLTQGVQEQPRLGMVGFLSAATLTDQSGSAPAWLPGYPGYLNLSEHAITSIPLDETIDAVIVAGAQYPLFGGASLAQWLWTFDGTGAFISQQDLLTSVAPRRIAAAQVLDRPETQIVIAGFLPEGTTVPLAPSARVEIVDYATGNVLWQSVALPTYSGAPMTKLEVADLDADGQLEIVLAFGEKVAIFKPSTGSYAVAEHPASHFSLLHRGPGQSAKFATLDYFNIAVYDGLSALPEKEFVLPQGATSIALFKPPTGENLMLATSSFRGTEIRRYDDGGVEISSQGFANNHSLAAMDIDGDRQIELIGGNLAVWRIDNDRIFRNGFNGPIE